MRLVLEYADRGSLRDALDGGAFLLPPGADEAGRSSADGGAGGRPRAGPALGEVNYCAVLDTAVEVAAAMAHLHGRNVLHADLKVGARVGTQMGANAHARARARPHTHLTAATCWART